MCIRDRAKSQLYLSNYTNDAVKVSLVSLKPVIAVFKQFSTKFDFDGLRSPLSVHRSMIKEIKRARKALKCINHRTRKLLKLFRHIFTTCFCFVSVLTFEQRSRAIRALQRARRRSEFMIRTESRKKGAK